MSERDLIRAFIVRELDWKEGVEALTDDYALFDNHVLDSVGVFLVVSFVEEQTGRKVTDDELTLENFQTIGAIARLIDAKRGAA